MKVLFIGIGNMGLPMAINLHKSGQQVVAVDMSKELLESAANQGLETASSALAALDGCDAIITMLPSDAAVQSVYLDSGLLESLAKDTLVIDCSTISAEAAKNLHSAGDALGVSVVDAPVSGGTAGAKAGTLSFICGGNEDALKRATPLLQVMGANVFHAGAAGAGQIAKIANNMLLAVLMTGTSEALSFGVDNGLDPAVLSEIMKASSGNSWVLEKYNPWPGVMDGVPAANGYQGGFGTALMQKDLGLALALAEQSNSTTPMGQRAQDVYAEFVAENETAMSDDFSGIVRHFSGRAASSED
ncbi:3-hydroxyisobutyrate dehydrogenase [uncultured Umboniibacter sp.]|uniref:3-hydroxyisobutyrate dehydrogenase n=1 Tax=uncultured Umboniibacter sp. TaxID=1798917 RepID=UPI002620E157|nr:3-hydroxyisobutyrate dehydrogenase [uncultured Umboniibacter sp.]